MGHLSISKIDIMIQNHLSKLMVLLLPILPGPVAGKANTPPTVPYGIGNRSTNSLIICGGQTFDNWVDVVFVTR